MGERLENCWEILNCGRERGGPNVMELGECIAAKQGLGHSCWAIAGTLCGGTVQGRGAEKIHLHTMRGLPTLSQNDRKCGQTNQRRVS